MKMLLRLTSALLIPALLFIFINVVLAEPLRSQPQVGQRLIAPELYGPAGRVITTVDPALVADPITGLTITHSMPVYAVIQPVFFTATVSSGSDIHYAWSFGDGQELVDTGATVSNTYASAGPYTVVVTAINFNIASPVTASILLSVAPDPASLIYQTYLPSVLKEAPAADLVCRINLDPPKPTAGQPVLITVEIENQGVQDADGFWVDFYIDPVETPSFGNLFTWLEACPNPSTCPGIAWSIGDDPLEPGESRELVSIPDNFDPNRHGFDPNHSRWDGSLSAGTHNLYAYVDSVEDSNPTSDGAVYESLETNNLCKELNVEVSSPAALVTGRSETGKLPTR